MSNEQKSAIRNAIEMLKTAVMVHDALDGIQAEILLKLSPDEYRKRLCDACDKLIAFGAGNEVIQ